jgi:hypothetical protein
MKEIDKKHYAAFLEVNKIEDSKEAMAGYLFCTFQSQEEAVELYKTLGRKCRRATAEYFPWKMTVEQFYEEIIGNKEAFIANMKILEDLPERRWAEDWIETLAAWSEMEKGDFSN